MLKFGSLSVFLFWPVQPVSSWMKRTNSQNLFWPDWPRSWIRAAQFSRSGWRKRGAREFGEFWREKCTRAPWTFPLKLARTSSSRPARTDTWKETEVWTGKMKFEMVLLLKICYGLTETSPVTTQSLTDDPVDLRVSTVGRAHPNVEVRHVTLALYS